MPLTCTISYSFMFLGRILSRAGTCFETHIGSVLVSQASVLGQLFWSHVDYCLKMCILILCPPSLSSVTYLLDSWTNVHTCTHSNVGRESDPFVSPPLPSLLPLLILLLCPLFSHPPPYPPFVSSCLLPLTLHIISLSSPPYPQYVHLLVPGVVMIDGRVDGEEQ